MPTTCELVFDRPTPVYFAGDQIGGKIVLTNTKAMRLDGIVIKCKGSAQVNWYETPTLSRTAEIPHNDSTDDADHRQVHYHDEETYLDEDVVVEAQPVTLEAGLHEFGFGFRLPVHCPSTCTLKYGAISYGVSLVLRRRSKHDKRYERRFLVKKRRHLEPESGEELKILDKGLGVCFSTPRSGFLPGQDISFRLDAALADAVLGRKQVRLCQRYVFQSRRQPVQSRKEVVYKLAATKCDLDPRTQAQEGSLRVPLLAPLTSDNPGGIIGVSYQLEAILYRSDKRKQVLAKLVIPIVLGSEQPERPPRDPWAEKQHLTGGGGTEREDDRRLICDLPRFCYDNPKIGGFNPQRTSSPRSALPSGVARSVNFSDPRECCDRRPLLLYAFRRDTSAPVMPFVNDVCMQLLMVL